MVAGPCIDTPSRNRLAIYRSGADTRRRGLVPEAEVVTP